MTDVTSNLLLTKVNKRRKAELTKSNLLFRKQILHHQKKTKADSKCGIFFKKQDKKKTKGDSLSSFFKDHMGFTVWMPKFYFKSTDFKCFEFRQKSYIRRGCLLRKQAKFKFE